MEIDKEEELEAIKKIVSAVGGGVDIGGNIKEYLQTLEVNLVSDFCNAIPKLSNKTLVEISKMIIKEVEKRYGRLDVFKKGLEK